MNEKSEKNLTMSEAAREARNAYRRKWAKENPEKVKAANCRYWEKKVQNRSKITQWENDHIRT